MSTIAMPPNTSCVECGAIVTSVEIIPGVRVPAFPGVPIEHASYKPCDRTGRNWPCGHAAAARWDADEVSSMP